MMPRLITTVALLAALPVILICAIVVVTATCLQGVREVWR